jgi:CDP-glucose 4,6-dehydratase
MTDADIGFPESEASFWRDRPTLVTGATGLVGSWLVKRLVDAGSTVVSVIRDWIPESELFQSDLLQRVYVVRSDVCEADIMEHVFGEYEVDIVMDLAAQTTVGIANRNPLSTFESNIKGTWTLLEDGTR